MAFDEITYALLKGKTSSLQNEIDILNGDAATDGSVENKIAEAISDSPEQYEKLQQLQEWLDGHSDMEAALIADVEGLKANKQDKLTAGDYITIDANNVIDVKVDTEIDSESTNPISNAAVAGLAAALEEAAQSATSAETTANNAADLATAANSNANEAKTEVKNKQDKLIAGENITIKDNVISATNGGNAKEMELTQAEYDALPAAKKNDGTTYYIKDGSSDPFTAGAAIDITSGVISVVSDAEISGNSTNPVQNKKVAEVISQLQAKDSEQDTAISTLGTQIAGVQSNLNTLEGALDNKQNKLTDSDDITIDNNIIDLSQNFKDGLNTHLHSLDSSVSKNTHDINKLDSDFESLTAVVADTTDEVNDLQTSVTNLSTQITGINSNINKLADDKQDKLTADDFSGITIDNENDTIRVNRILHIADGEGTHVRVTSSIVEGRPAREVDYIDTNYTIKEVDGKYYNYDTQTSAVVDVETNANHVAYDPTSTVVTAGSVSEALQNLATEVNEAENKAGGAAAIAQQVQGQMQGINDAVNVLYSTVSQLDGKYLPIQNPQYNGTFSNVGNYALGTKSIALGNGSSAMGINAIALGNESFVLGDNSVGFGSSVMVPGTAAFACGFQTTAENFYTHAEGLRARASGDQSHAEGENTRALGPNSHAEGYQSTADSNGSHAEGAYTKADSDGSHAEGSYSQATYNCAHAEGYNTTASGAYSHSEGAFTLASNEAAHSAGYQTTASGKFQTVIGAHNIIDENNEFAFIVGVGKVHQSESDPEDSYENGLTVNWNGEAAAANFATTVDGTKYTLTQIISALKNAGILS